MSFISDSLARFGYTRLNQNQTKEGITKAADTFSTPAGAFMQAVSGGQFNQSFSSFNNQKQQLQSYTDWVYIAVSTIAQYCSVIDFRLYVNRTGMKNASLHQKIIQSFDRRELRLELEKLKQTKTYEIVNKDGRIVYKNNVPMLEELSSHPLLDLLNEPNEYFTKNEFFELTFIHLGLTGEAFWAVERDKKGIPFRLWPLMPNLMQVVPDETHFVLGYLYTINGQQIPFDPDDIIHHKMANPLDFHRGYSSVQAGARDIDADNHASDWNRKLMYNRATPDGALVIPADKKMDDKTFKRLKQEWNDTYGGTANAHRVAILEGGADFKKISLTPVDMDFKNLREANRDKILTLFKVPKSVVGLIEDVNRASAETSDYTFTKGVVRPNLERITNRITTDLAIQFKDERLLLSFTDPVPDDKEFHLKETQASLGMGGNLPWITPQEARAVRGNNFIQGADEYFIQANWIPITEKLKAPKEQGKASVAIEEESQALATGDGEDQTEDSDGSGQDSNDNGSGNNSGGDDPNAGTGSGGVSPAGDSGSATSDATSGASTSPKAFAASNGVTKLAASEVPGLYDDLDIDVSKLGCIMLDTETVPVLKYVKDGEKDLIKSSAWHDHTTGAVAESEAHVTLLFGLLENGNKWKSKVDSVLKDWKLDSVVIDSVGSFDLGESHAIVAHIQKTPTLVDGHERLTLLPHVNTFSEYKPHLTLAYVKHDNDTRDKWVNSLSVQYSGKVLKTVGINYGDKPETSDSTKSVGCRCCALCIKSTGLSCCSCVACMCRILPKFPGFTPAIPFELPKPKPKPSDKLPVFPPSIPEMTVMSLLGKTLIGREDGPEMLLEVNSNKLKASAPTREDAHESETPASKPVDNSPRSGEEYSYPATWTKDMHQYVDKQVRLVKRFEIQFVQSSAQHFREQEHEVLHNLNQRFAKGFKTVKAVDGAKQKLAKTDKSKLDSLFGKALSLAGWMTLFVPIYSILGKNSGDNAVQLVNDPQKYGYTGTAPATPYSYNNNEKAVQTYFNDHADTISKGIDETTDRMLRATLTEGINAGEDLSDLTDRVESVYRASSGYRALRIARTESMSAMTYASSQAWEQSGQVAEYQWSTGPNPCKICMPLDGVISKSVTGFSSGGLTGSPPLHPNCILPNQDTEAYDVYSKMDMEYNGPAVELTFASGKRLSVTPNHRVATPNGWVAANLLNEKDNVLSAPNGFKEMAAVINPDAKSINASIQDVSVSNSVIFGLVPVASVDFHGDEIFGKNVNVVLSNSRLRNNRNTSLTKFFNNYLFGWRNIGMLALISKCSFNKTGLSPLYASNSGMSSLSFPLPVNSSEGSVKQKRSFPYPANSDTELLKAVGQDESANSGTIGKFLDRFASVISVDKIVKVRNFDFSGHVYDLSTSLKFYTVNTIITHNCACILSPYRLKTVDEMTNNMDDELAKGLKFNPNHGADGRFSSGGGGGHGGGSVVQEEKKPYDGTGKSSTEISDFIKSQGATEGTGTEKDSLNYYASYSGSYKIINGALRGDPKHDLNSTVLDRRPDEEGVRQDTVRNVMSKMDSLMRQNVTNDSFMAYRAYRIQAHDLNSYQVGGKITNKGYSSTSLDPKVAEDFGREGFGKRAQLNITVPAGTHGVFTENTISKTLPEAEFILPRATSYTINKIEETTVLGDPTTVYHVSLNGK